MSKIQPKRPKKRRVSGMLIFGLTFFLFLAVFGAVMLWGMAEFWRQTSVNPSSEHSSSDKASDEPSFDDADIRSLLIVTELNSQAQGFVLVSADPGASRIRAVAIPRETAVAVGTEQTRLFELYKSQDMRTVRDTVAGLLGVTVDNYAVITYSNIEKVISHFESGLIFEVPENLHYSDPGGSFSIQLTSGAHVLTGPQTTGMLRYPSWQGGRRQTAKIQAQVAAALINQYMTEGRIEKGPADFTALVNLVRSDILASQYYAAKEGLDHLARRNDGSLCSVVFLEGEYVGNGDAMRFEVADIAIPK